MSSSDPSGVVALTKISPLEVCRLGTAEFSQFSGPLYRTTNFAWTLLPAVQTNEFLLPSKTSSPSSSSMVRLTVVGSEVAPSGQLPGLASRASS